MNQEKSKALFEKANKFIPGGVNSPVRAFKSVGGTPLFIKNAKGAYLFDEDGNRFIDYIGSWGPMICGHAFEPVIEAIREKALDSTSFGAPTVLEVELAELICENVPGIDMIRMVNSGTEATMSAVRLARGFTGRNKFIKFAGCYHGHGDSFLIKAGSGALTFGQPNSPGVTKATAADTLLANFNDLKSVEDLVDQNKGEIAAIILEPVPGNMGCIPPAEGLLKALRELCDRENIILIFDEVMTGFRLGFGGAQETYGVKADLTTYGKIIGAGMPVGAYGGKKEIMEYVSPTGPVYQAGTLSGNPLAMIAGITLLKHLKNNPQIYSRLASFSETLENGLRDALEVNGLPGKINRMGSMISLHFTDTEVVDLETASSGDNDKFRKFFHEMLSRGVYLPPSAYETWFLSDALTEEDLRLTIQAAAESLSKLKRE